jgi:phage baseplate assembly protein W
MHPDYGSDLDRFVFEGVNRSILTYMETMVSDAILFNEPRILLNEVKIEPQPDNPSYLVINVDYTISATNNRYNFVYPFYIKEATNLQK